MVTLVDFVNVARIRVKGWKDPKGFDRRWRPAESDEELPERTQAEAQSDRSAGRVWCRGPVLAR
jgi:hypothetical protein